MNNFKRPIKKETLFFLILFSFIITSCFFVILPACHQNSSSEWLGRIERNDQILRSRLILTTEEDPKIGAKVSRGSFAVYENRNAQTGRMIHLNVVVLHALSPAPRPDPIFFLAGGPGADVTESWKNFQKSIFRQERDIVLVSQRGTGGDNRLDCPEVADDNNLQNYLDPLF